MRNQEIAMSDENLALIFKHIDKSFDEAQHTGKLNLSAKKLRGLPRSVTQFDLSDLYLADFSKNRLNHFPNFIFNFLSLEKLDVHGNSIKTIPESITQLKNLLLLNIKSNQLTTFPSHACSLTFLQVLNLSSNKITSLSPDIHLLSSLMLLDVSNNLLTDLPDTITHLSKLKWLDLHKNQLTFISPGFSELPLIRLDISVNHITHLPPTIHLIKTLEILNLDNNPLILPPPHIVIKGKEHVLTYMRRLKVEQNTRRLNEGVVVRSPSQEVPHASSWSFSGLPYRRQESDTCLNHFTHSTPTSQHRTSNLRVGRSAGKPPYATSTIDVASHRRQKESFKEFYSTSKARNHSKSGQKVTTRTGARAGSKEEVNSGEDAYKRQESGSKRNHLKPPPHRVPFSGGRQTSMRDLSRRTNRTSLSSEHLARHRSSRSDREDDGGGGSDGSAESGDSSSSDSNRTLNVGSPDGIGSLKRREAKRQASNEGNEAVNEGESKGVGLSIEETIKLTLMNMQRKEEPSDNKLLKFTISEPDAFENLNATTFPAMLANSKEEVNNKDEDEEEEDDDDEDDDDVSDYGDGIDDDEEDEAEKVIKKKSDETKERRRLNLKQLPRTKQSGEEEFVRKASDLRQQREVEARKIKKSLTSPPLTSDSSSTTSNKGLSQKCQQMLEALSSQLNSQDPVLTIRRNLQHSATEKQQARKLKKTLEDMLHLRLRGDLGASLKDGVLLCKLANKLFPSSVTKIHTPSQPNEKLSDAKCRKNVENFLIACRKLGLPKESPQSFEQAVSSLVASLDNFIQGSGCLSSQPLTNGHNGHTSNNHHHHSSPSSFHRECHQTLSLLPPHHHPSFRDQGIACFGALFFIGTCLALFLYPLPD